MFIPILNEIGKIIRWTPASQTSESGAFPHAWHYADSRALYQDSGKTIPAISDGDPIGVSVNQGSDSHDITQSTGANRPTLKTGIVNGKDVFRGGGGHWLTGTFDDALVQPFVVFAVAALDVGAVNDNNDHAIMSGSTSYQMRLRQDNDSSPDIWDVYAGDDVDGGASDSNWHIWTAWFDGYATHFWIDGVLQGSGFGGNHNPVGLTVLAQLATGEALWVGDVAEVLVYNDPLCISDWNEIGVYLSSKYGISYTKIVSPTTLYQEVDINGRSYRRNAIASTDIGGVEYQAHAFWNDYGNGVIQIRDNSDGSFGAWTTYIYDAINYSPQLLIGDNKYTTAWDNDHLALNLAFDNDGYLHIAYGYTETVHYRKSSSPIDSFDGMLTDELQFTGSNETSMAYPSFFNAPDGTLYFMFRAGSATNGDTYFYEYDEVTGWAAAVGTSAGGRLIDGNVTASTPYLYSCGFDAGFPGSGYMHFAWHWRYPGSPGGQQNRDLCYAKWDGSTFKQSDGSVQTVPITPANAEVADNVGVASGLAGQGRVESDNNGYPHIVYIKNDGSGYAQVYHIWHNGSAWQSPLGLTSQGTVLGGGDPENDEWRAPTIAINQGNGHAYVFYTLLTKTGIYVLDSLNYVAWGETQVDASQTGEWSPNFDPWQWYNNGTFYLAMQPNYGAIELSYEIVEYTPV